jgi:hypothetical protein
MSMTPRPTTGMPGVSAGLLGRAIRVGTVRVGEVTGVLVDAGQLRPIGLEVASGGGARRFLPWFAASVEPEGVRIESALLLVDEVDAYERLGARTLREPEELDELAARSDGRLDGGTVNGRAGRFVLAAPRPQPV